MPPAPPGTPADSPRFSRLFGTVLGSPFLTTSDGALLADPDDLDLVDGASSAVPHICTVTRPASPTPTADYSIIAPPTPSNEIFQYHFTTPPRGLWNTPTPRSPSAYYGTERNSPLRSLLPRIWDAFSSPGRKTGKGRAQYHLDYSFDEPLDGEEGELIDDEACFIDVRRVTGIDILTLLPPELALDLLKYLDLPSILACLSVSRAWRALAADNAVWAALFAQRAPDGWGVDIERAKARGWGAEGTGASVRESLIGTKRKAIEEWGRRRLTSGGGIREDRALSVVIKSPRRSIGPIAPLMLDWRVLYRTRLELQRRWATADPKVMRLAGHADSVYCLEFDSARIITGSRDRTIKVWGLRSGRLLGTFRGHGGSVLCLKFDKDWDVPRADRPVDDGDLAPCADVVPDRYARTGFMVSGSSDCSVCVWDVRVVRGREGEEDEVRAEVRAVLRGHAGGVLDLRIDKDWIVSCSKDAVIRVWSRATLQLHCTLRGHEGPVNAVGLQNGRVVSASGDGKMMLWDVRTGARVRVLEGHDRGLACIEFKDDLIVSGSNDCKIKVWSARTGECLRTLVGHEALVRALACDPASGRLVSASYDRAVKVWDLRSGRLVREFRASHVSHIFDVKFDVSRIVSTSHDQKIVVLDFGAGLDTALFT